MIVIGDAGGSTTDWRILDNKQIFQHRTIGINVVVSPIDKYVEAMRKDLAKYSVATDVFFYAAGVKPSGDVVGIVLGASAGRLYIAGKPGGWNESGPARHPDDAITADLRRRIRCGA